MNNQTIAALETLGHRCATELSMPEVAQELGMSMDCDLPKGALEAATAMKGELLLPMMCRAYAQHKETAIKLRVRGEIGLAELSERRADFCYRDMPEEYQW